MSVRVQAGRPASNFATTQIRPTSGRSDTSHLTSVTQASRSLPVRQERSSVNASHLLQTSFGEPSRQVPTRVGNVATQSFINHNPAAQTVFHSNVHTVPSRVGHSVLVTPPTLTTTTHSTRVGILPRRSGHVVVTKSSGSCWAKFVAFLALIFCCGLLTKPYRN